MLDYKLNLDAECCCALQSEKEYETLHDVDDVISMANITMESRNGIVISNLPVLHRLSQVMGVITEAFDDAEVLLII